LPFVAVVMTLVNVLGGARRAQRGLGRRVASLVALFAVLAFAGALMVFGILAAIFSSGGNAAANFASSFFLCLTPAALLVFLAWMAVRARQRQQGGAAEAEQQDRPVEPAAATTQTRSPAGAPVRTSAKADAAPAQLVPAPAFSPEKGARPPSEYRQRAASYRRRIQSLLKSRRPGPFADRLAGVLSKLTSWEERVGQLADRVALFETDDLIRRDIEEVPNRIARMRRQISLEADPDMRGQMERTLAAYEEQQRQLEALARVMRRTRLNLDDTLAAMGTIYSQVQVLNAMDVDGATATRIADEIDVEVDRLNDLLSALSEINHQGTAAPAAVPGGDRDAESGLSGRRARLERGGTAG
jgi:hypothetical protein